MIVAISLYCLVVAALSGLMTYLLMRYRPLMDVPNARSSHDSPTPRGGGIAIVAATIIGVAALALDGHPGIVRDSALLGVLFGALTAAASGLADDIKPLSYAVKLASQAAAAVVAMAFGVSIDTLYVPGIGAVELGAFGSVLTLLWLVGMTNAYNFMDGIDGLAGGTGLVAAAFFAAALIALGATDAGALAATLSAAAAGFLVFNRPRARIFMGDVGSQFLGFAFAALGAAAAAADRTGTVIFLAPLLLFHFLFDTVVTAARRWRRGEKVTQAHRSHLYQRLTHAGFGHGRTTALLCAIGIAQGAAALWMIGAAPDARLWALAAALFVQLVYVAAVMRREQLAAHPRLK